MNAPVSDVLAEVEGRATELFPARVPEPTEVMTPEESAALATWQASPLGRGVYAGQAQHAIERLELSTGRVVSVGEGEGRLAWELARRLPQAEVIGVDLCPEAVGAARRKHQAPNLRFEVASAEDLSAFAPARAVVCMFALHHLARPQVSLASMAALLAPGGGAYFMDLRRDASLGAYYRRLDEYVAVAPQVAPLFRASIAAAYTDRELADLLAPFTADGEVEVGRVEWGAAARAAFREQEPEAALTLPPLLQDTRGLWCEAVARRRSPGGGR